MDKDSVRKTEEGKSLSFSVTKRKMHTEHMPKEQLL
jgi:hypothetical protein